MLTIDIHTHILPETWPDLRERYGYPELTPALKAKILGLNAARVYDIDVERVRRVRANEDLAWLRAALAEYRGSGNPSL